MASAAIGAHHRVVLLEAVREALASAYRIPPALGCRSGDGLFVQLSSLIFYERLGLGYDFAGLPMDAVAQTADYLWTAYAAGNVTIGGGISAFPSLHVAVAVWMALVVRHWLGWVFVALISIGAVMLGWHYFLESARRGPGDRHCLPMGRADDPAACRIRIKPAALA